MTLFIYIYVMICPPPKNVSRDPTPLPCLLLYLHKAGSEQYLSKRSDEHQRVPSSMRRKMHAGLILCSSLQREVDIDFLVWDKKGLRKGYHLIA